MFHKGVISNLVHVNLLNLIVSIFRVGIMSFVCMYTKPMSCEKIWINIPRNCKELPRLHIPYKL